MSKNLKKETDDLLKETENFLKEIGYKNPKLVYKFENGTMVWASGNKEIYVS